MLAEGPGRKTARRTIRSPVTHSRRQAVLISPVGRCKGASEPPPVGGYYRKDTVVCLGGQPETHLRRFLSSEEVTSHRLSGARRDVGHRCSGSGPRLSIPGHEAAKTAISPDVNIGSVSNYYCYALLNLHKKWKCGKESRRKRKEEQ